LLESLQQHKPIYADLHGIEFPRLIGFGKTIVFHAMNIALKPFGSSNGPEPIRSHGGEIVEGGPQRFADQFQQVKTVNGGEHMRGVRSLLASRFDEPSLPKPF
jgi:hypothetical protein